MGIKVALEHRTSYTFDRLVEVYPHVVRLRPAPHSRTPIEAYSLRSNPPTTSSTGSRTRSATSWPGWCSRTGRRSLTHHGRPDRRSEGDQPVRLLHRGVRRDLSASPTRRRWPTTSSPTCARSTRTTRAPGPATWSRRGCRTSGRPAGTRTIDFLVALNRASRRRRLQRADGTRRADPGLHAAHGHRLVPRLGLAAGLAAARAGPGRPVRLRLPGAADLRHPVAGRAVRAGRRLHRPARLGRGLHPGRRLDRHGPDVGPVRRRGPHPAVGDPAPGVARRRSPAPPSRARPPWSSPTSSRRMHEDPRVTLPYTDAAVGAPSTRSAPRSTSGWRRATSG